MHKSNEIRSVPCPHCKLCGFSGLTTHQGLSDHLFSAPGLWNFKKCENKKCGLMWLDPMPLEEDIHRAYRSYFTHERNALNESTSKHPLTKMLTFLYLLFLRLTPIHRKRVELDRMFLENIEPGRLLDVGCGNGDRLVKLANLGWSVEGQETDQMCISIAEKTGFIIHLGPLENLGLPDASYDAIVMNHVIEHVHDPVKLFTVCRRLLKQSGILVVVTPNNRSLGHRIFKSYWRGLEPPRHVLLHSQASLHCAAKQAGFKNPTTWTCAANADYLAKYSLQIIYGGNNPIFPIKVLYYFSSMVFLFFEVMLSTFNKDFGEELVLAMKKE